MPQTITDPSDPNWGLPASAAAAASGLLVPGNVDLRAQPNVKNPNGSISTVDSSSYNIDGKEVLLPSVTPDGRHLTNPKDIISEYRKTGRHLGIFADAASATQYAQQLHQDYAAGIYSAPGTAPPGRGPVITDPTNPNWGLERPPDFRATNEPPSPSLWQQANTPLIPQIHAAGKAVADWMTQPTLGVGTPERGRYHWGDEFTTKLNAQLRGAVAGGIEGASDLLANFTSPIGLALTLAGFGPESRLVKAVPALKPLVELPAVRGLQRTVRVGAGAGFAAHGAERVATAPTWGEKAEGVVELAAGGLGIAPEVTTAKAAYTAARRTWQGAEATHAFQQAVPPSKATPYTPEDLHAAMPWLDVEHATTPITTIKGLRDAADTAISRIETHVQQAIAANPQDLIRNTPMTAVTNALRRFTRSDAMAAGLKEIESFHLDQPLTVERADRIRRDLNAENTAVLKRNAYDVATARAVDPGFAAREAASRALRDGVYQQLEARGIPGVRELRQDEGALLSVRNATERQIFSGEKPVRIGEPSIARRVAAQGARMAGAGAGAVVGGPFGAAAGGEIGGAVGGFITRGPLTRDALVAKAFRVRPPATAPTVPAVPAARPVRGLLGEGPRITPAPEDVSGGKLVPAKKALPVRDPKTGEWKTVWLSDADYEAVMKAMKK